MPLSYAYVLLDYKETFPDIPVHDLPCMEPVLDIVLGAEAEYETTRPGLALGDCVDVWMLGVHPEYRRRNIAQLLTEISIKHAFVNKFKYVILESTGSYSARCAEKAGMRVAVKKVGLCLMLHYVCV
jgi:GNAT superfamily N-acetyltransferase